MLRDPSLNPVSQQCVFTPLIPEHLSSASVSSPFVYVWCKFSKLVWPCPILGLFFPPFSILFSHSKNIDWSGLQILCGSDSLEMIEIFMLSDGIYLPLQSTINPNSLPLLTVFFPLIFYFSTFYQYSMNHYSYFAWFFAFCFQTHNNLYVGYNFCPFAL